MAFTALNMSACSASAMSQVGWRLMVASMAKTSRPRPAAVRGASSFMRRTKSATSASEVARAGGVCRASDGTVPGGAWSGAFAWVWVSRPPILVLSLSVMARPAPVSRVAYVAR